MDKVQSSDFRVQSSDFPRFPNVRIYLSLHIMKITIDKAAGFCPGVQRAIRKAEKNLHKEGAFHSLGSLLHNEAEMVRLEEHGLKVVGHVDIPGLGGHKLLIRAHGEPPETYLLAEEHGVEVVDATCSVVKRLQQQVRQAALEMEKVNGQVVIFGKKGHPEVEGLVGQAQGLSIVIGSADDLKRIDLTKPIRLFSQTTMDADQYLFISDSIQKKVYDGHANPDFQRIHINCWHVTRRVPALLDFARRHDVVIFVSGRESSNGKKLFKTCSEHNPDTYFISGPEELKKAWFEGREKIGISGAASTPLWLMEEIAEKIKEMA